MDEEEDAEEDAEEDDDETRDETGTPANSLKPNSTRTSERTPKLMFVPPITDIILLNNCLKVKVSSWRRIR